MIEYLRNGKSGCMNSEHTPQAEVFMEHLVSCNALCNDGFKEWVFHPGMLFNAGVKWWGDKGKRNRPHEGLDLSLFRTGDGEVRHLNKGSLIPVMFAGKAVKISNDFLGESVFVCHGIYNNRGEQLLTAYGHLKLDKGIYPGRVLREEDLLGSIADTGNRKIEILPHLHISVAWISKSLRCEDLDWAYISDPGMAVLLDPLQIIDCRYSISDSV